VVDQEEVEQVITILQEVEEQEDIELQHMDQLH
jgi:hypothetical protein